MESTTEIDLSLFTNRFTDEQIISNLKSQKEETENRTQETDEVSKAITLKSEKK